MPKKPLKSTTHYQLLVLHGPNLNLLGQRETLLYGTQSLEAINQGLIQRAPQHVITCYQSNAEHELVNAIQQAKKTGIDFIVINPAAFTHTSIAIRDALLAVDIPFIEVHLTNILARESFRHHSYLSDIAVGVVSGLGPIGYEAALDAAIAHLSLTP